MMFFAHLCTLCSHETWITTIKTEIRSEPHPYTKGLFHTLLLVMDTFVGVVFSWIVKEEMQSTAWEHLQVSEFHNVLGYCGSLFSKN